MKSLADQLRADLKENYSLIASLPIGNPLDHELSVSSEFGYRHDPINGRLATHSGLDLESKSGEPVFATADGEIVTAEWSGSYGNMVEIRHANGFLTRYGHLKTIRVKLGDHVSHHQLIGQVGSTGRSTGPHLHYEIIAATGRTIDPKDFLSPISQFLICPSSSALKPPQLVPGGRRDSWNGPTARRLHAQNPFPALPAETPESVPA